MRVKNCLGILSGLITWLIPAYVLANTITPIDQYSWMSEQIQEDLTPFVCCRVNRSQVRRIGQTVDPAHEVILVSLQNGKAHLSTTAVPFAPSNQPRFEELREFFDRLVQKHVLPDVDFLLSMQDGFDENLGVPVFSFAKPKTSSAVLIPDFEVLNHSNDLIASCDEASNANPWDTKKAIIFWRGSTTGGEYRLDNYRSFSRTKLVFLSVNNSSWLDAAFTNFCQGSPEVYDRIAAQARPLFPYLPIRDHFDYKYLIDVDGNSCTYGRCRWILLSNSLLLKPDSPNIQWYYKTMQPWIHYIPVSEDFSNLAYIYTWLVQQDNRAEIIAQEGRELGKTIFSEEAVELYMLLLIEEYSKLQID